MSFRKKTKSHARLRMFACHAGSMVMLAGFNVMAQSQVQTALQPQEPSALKPSALVYRINGKRTRVESLDFRVMDSPSEFGRMNFSVVYEGTGKPKQSPIEFSLQLFRIGTQRLFDNPDKRHVTAMVDGEKIVLGTLRNARPGPSSSPGLQTSGLLMAKLSPNAVILKNHKSEDLIVEWTVIDHIPIEMLDRMSNAETLELAMGSSSFKTNDVGKDWFREFRATITPGQKPVNPAFLTDNSFEQATSPVRDETPSAANGASNEKTQDWLAKTISTSWKSNSREVLKSIVVSNCQMRLRLDPPQLAAVAMQPSRLPDLPGTNYRYIPASRVYNLNLADLDPAELIPHHDVALKTVESKPLIEMATESNTISRVALVREPEKLAFLLLSFGNEDRAAQIGWAMAHAITQCQAAKPTATKP